MKTTAALLAAFMLSRYAVSVDTTDTSTPRTIIELLVGAGSYAEVSRDCNGNVTAVRDVPYSEYGISISHTFSVVKIGVSGGVTNSRRSAAVFSSMADSYVYDGQTSSRFPYIAPQVGLNTKYVGMDIGYLFDLTKPPAPSPDYPYYSGVEEVNGTWIGGLRLGRLDRTYFYANHGMSIPLSVGSGVIETGIGFGSTTNGPRFCLGLGAIPDDGLMFSAKGDFPVSEHFLICARGHLAPGDGTGYGVAGGIKIRF